MLDGRTTELGILDVALKDRSPGMPVRDG